MVRSLNGLGCVASILAMVACGASLGSPPDESDPDGGGRKSDGGATSLINYTPSNVPVEQFSVGTASINLFDDITINSDNGLVSGPGASAISGDSVFGVVTQGTDMPSLGVFSWKNLNIPAGTTVMVTGSNALVLVVREYATIDGLIDVSGGRVELTTPGPGGFLGGDETIANGRGDGGGASLTGYDCGGGGGGFADLGGDGGRHQGRPGGGAGIAMGEQTNVPLHGGAGGARGGNNGNGSGLGGGGGGALQISSRGEVRFGPDSGINVSGGAGLGGSNDHGGGGGGAGGAVLIEGRDIIVAGTIAANGGGGGAGAAGNAQGANGEVGSLGELSAAGGPAGGEGSAGGAGAAGDVAVGLPGGASIGNSGGGGGGGGRIFLRSRETASVSGVISPTASLATGTL